MGKCYYPNTHLATPSLHPTGSTRQGMTWLWAHQVLLSYFQCELVTKIHKTPTHHGHYPLSQRVGPYYAQECTELVTRQLLSYTHQSWYSDRGGTYVCANQILVATVDAWEAQIRGTFSMVVMVDCQAEVTLSHLGRRPQDWVNCGSHRILETSQTQQQKSTGTSEVVLGEEDTGGGHEWWDKGQTDVITLMMCSGYTCNAPAVPQMQCLHISGCKCFVGALYCMRK